MDSKERLFDKIEDYLRGRLSDEEARAFEQQMDADPELAEQVELHRFEEMGMEFLLEEELRKKMQAWKSEGRQPGPSSKGAFPRRGFWLGLLLLAVAAGFFFFRNASAPSAEPEPPSVPPPSVQPAPPTGPVAEQKGPASTPGQQPVPPEPESELLAILDAFYEPPPNFTDAGLRGENGKAGQSALEQGIQAFAEGDYQKAIRLLKRVRPEEGEEAYETALECLAHAYLKGGQYGDAAGLFQAMLSRNYPAPINDRAEWYLLLSLLPDYPTQRQRVDQLLDKTAGDAFHTYHAKAVQLKSRLD